MTADFINTLFLGALTYLVHSTVFLGLAFLLTSGQIIKNLGLKELIWKLALFAGFVTAPLQMSGAFDLFTHPIGIPEKTVVAETPVFEPRVNSQPAVTAEPNSQPTGPVSSKPAPAKEIETLSGPWSTATVTLMVWVLLGLALLGQLGFLALNLKTQLNGRRKVSDPLAIGLVKNLSGKLDIEKPRLSMKKHLASPFCLASGEIVIPDWALDLPRRQLKAMLAHEMAHLKRRDPAWLITGRIIQGMLFFQPLNFLANAKLAELSEYACDAWSKKVCGSGLDLAECLAECAKRQLGSRPAALGMAMATRRSPVIERTRLLLENVRDYTRPASLLSRSAAIGLFIGTGAMIPAFAVEAAKQDSEKTFHFETPAISFSGQEKAANYSGEIHGTAHFSTSSHIIENDDGNMDIKISYSDDDSTMKIRGEGMFRFNDDETAMDYMSEDSYLDITETRNGTTRRVRFENGEGKTVETLWLNGSKTAKNEAMQHWLDEVIPAFYRQTGIDAEGRTKRIYKARGADGVLDEIAQIRSSYTFRSYATALVGLTELDGKQTARFLALAATMAGSYDLRETLTAFAQNQKLTAADMKAFVEAAAKISSSYDLRETLSTIAGTFSGDAENWLALLDATGNISSSYDLRETLVAFKDAMPKGDNILSALAGRMKTIPSSYDLRETLTAYVEKGGYSEQGWLTLLDVVGEISSDYDRRSTLEEFAEAMPKSETLLNRYKEIANSIGSQYDREQALLAIV